jgi:hypothetical protein
VSIESEQMEALKVSLAAALPGRAVGRSMQPLGMVKDADLRAGVVSLVRLGEKDYANYRGREADLGTVEAVIVGQLAVDQNDDPLAVEEAENELASEIKAWLAGPMPAGIGECLATGFRQSGQIEFPAGWVMFKVEIRE